MLKDRKVLVEHEITKLTEEAAHLYLDIIRGNVTQDAEYDRIRERITDLQHERKMIQLLLDKGTLC
jgi:hypothetical protein